MKLSDAHLDDDLIEFFGKTVPERTEVARELMLVLRGFGLKNVFSHMRDADLSPLQKMSRCTVLDLLLSTGRKWLESEELEKVARSIIRREPRIRILLSRQRMDDKRYLYEQYDRRLRELEIGEWVKVRLYDEKPIFRAVISNRTELTLSHYHYKDEEMANDGWDTPHLRFEEAGAYSLSGPFNQLFDRMWALARPLDEVITAQIATQEPDEADVIRRKPL
mgnify:CR=1 FL=1